MQIGEKFITELARLGQEALANSDTGSERQKALEFGKALAYTNVLCSLVTIRDMQPEMLINCSKEN